MKQYFIYFIGFALIFSACNPDIQPELLVESIQVPSNSGPASACGVSFVIRDTAYLMKGRTNYLTNELWRWDKAEAKWNVISVFPGTQRINAVAQVIGNKAYIGLGYYPSDYFESTAFVQDLWCYDPITNNWDSLAPYPDTNTNKCASFTYQNELYVLNGYESHLIASGGYTRRCWKYNPATNQWTGLSDFPGYMRATSVAVSDGNRIFCGTGYCTWNLNDWWEYFPESDSWKELKHMPDNGRCEALAFSINGRFFVSTGRYFAGKFTGGHLKNDITEYVPAENKWYRRGEIPVGIENAVSFILDNQVYIGFGERDSLINNTFWKITIPDNEN